MSGLLRQAGNGAGSKRPAPAPAAGQGDAKRLMTRPEIIDRRTPGDKFVSEATKLKDVRKEMHCVAVLVNGANKGRPNVHPRSPLSDLADYDQPYTADDPLRFS